MAILGQLREVHRHVRELERIDDTTSALVSGFESAQVELEELDRGLQRYVNTLEINPAEVSRLEARIDLIESLKRKYGGSVESVLAFGELAERKLNAIEGRGDELHRLEQIAGERLQELRERGNVLSATRLQSAPELAAEVAGHLRGSRIPPIEVRDRPEGPWKHPGPPAWNKSISNSRRTRGNPSSLSG